MLAQGLRKTWSEHGALVFKVDDEKIQAMILATLKADREAEAQLDKEVNEQLDQLERTHGGEFDRYKMFPLLKRKMAEDKGFVL